MKERGILFSGPMVRANRAGLKSQTRRTSGLDQINEAPDDWVAAHQLQCGDWQFTPLKSTDAGLVIRCRYGLAGDRLWVRETWAVGKCADGFKPRELAPRIWMVENGSIWYVADGSEPTHPISPRGKTRVSIFMPRWASRDSYDVLSVRPERLLAITEADAIAEGIERVGGPTSCEPWRNYRIGEKGEMSTHCSAPTRSYQTLWESINGDGSWIKNPWVWRVEYLNPLRSDFNVLGLKESAGVPL